MKAMYKTAGMTALAAVVGSQLNDRFVTKWGPGDTKGFVKANRNGFGPQDVGLFGAVFLSAVALKMLMRKAA